MTFKCGLEVIEIGAIRKHRYTVSYSPSIVTMAISCIVRELLVENRKFFIPHLYLAPTQGLTPSEFQKMFDAGKTRMIGLPYGEKIMTIC